MVALGTGGGRPVVGLDLGWGHRRDALSRYMSSYGQSFDYVGVKPTWNAGNLLVLDDDDVLDLLRSAIEREGSQTAFANRHGINRAIISSILNGRRRISASLVGALGLRRVYVVE